MRQYGTVPPWLAASNTPAVAGTTGLGTRGGAAVQTPDSGGFGDILVYPDANFSGAGSVSIQFPSAPPTLFIGAAAEFGPVTQATVGNVVTISWTVAAFNKPASGNFPYVIHYEWTVSK